MHQAERERRAEWVAYLLSAQVGEVVTPAQLLGTEGDVNASRVSEAERHLAAMEERMKAAGV